MDLTSEKTVVMFRILEGDVIAIFPEVPGDVLNYLMMESYMHQGGFSPAAGNIVSWTKPASPEEYASLKLELESDPYNYVLDIRDRTPKDAAEKRRKAIRNER